ncbi:retrovirus-related pol polyprotein from transposon TNT 1-94 [Tanacetum coccineum]
MQNFEIQFLKEAAKFVRDFISLTKEAEESLAKQKGLELEIECLLRAIVSQDILSIMQSNSVLDTSNLQTELDSTKERFENSYNDMQQKIERLQAQLGDQKGKSCDTQCASNTLDPLSQKLENENVELEFQVRNYENEIAHLKTTYKNLFDSISVTRAQTKTIIDSLQNKLHDTIYENAKLRAQLFDKVSEQVDTTKGTSTNTKFANQSTERKLSLQPIRKNRVPQKVDETNDLSKPVTSNSVPTPQESKIVKHDNVIAPGMFRINPFKPSREEKDNTAKTRRPQPRSNTKNDRVPSASKSSCNKNKEVEVEEHPRNLLLSKNKKHMSSECNHVKLAIRNDKSEVICAMCKQCLITANHDVCVLNYVNDMNSRNKKQKPKVIKPKKVGSNERLASPKPSKPRFCLRWSPTGRLFDIKGKIIASSESESQSDCSNGDNACTSNPSEPTIKWFPNSTSFLPVCFRLEVASEGTLVFVKKSEGVDLLKGNRTTNLYTINLHEMASASLICLMARATSTKSWLWHQRLSHLNFDTINDLAKDILSPIFQNSNIIKSIFVPPVSKEKAKGRLTHPNQFQIQADGYTFSINMDWCPQ